MTSAGGSGAEAPLPACPKGASRSLTPGEVEIARGVFGDALDYSRVEIRRRKWFAFQPRRVTMAPLGHLHFHPESPFYSDDFAREDVLRQGLLIHELTHVWQTREKGRWYLVLHRHPLCRYDYALKPGRPLDTYGIEQQAEIVRHAFLMRRGVKLAGVADKAAYDALVRFPGATL